MKKNDKISDTSTAKKRADYSSSKKSDTHIDKINNKIPAPDKSNIKSKILNIHMKHKFDSLKSEKSPDKIAANYKRYEQNIKKKNPSLNNTNTKNTTESTINSINLNNKHSRKSNNSLNKFEQKKTSFQVDFSISPMVQSALPSENSMSYLQDNYHLSSKYVEFCNPLININFSDKILTLVEKISNFLIVSSEEPNFIYNKDNNCFVKKENNSNIELDIFSSDYDQTHNRKNFSENLDRIFINNLLNSQKETQVNKLDMFFQEIENIYHNSSELHDSVKLSSNINKLADKDKKEEIMPLSTQAILNVEMIKDYSDGRMSTYKRLLSTCTLNLKEISSTILSSMDKAKKTESYFDIDPYDKPAKKNLNCDNNTINKNKNQLITEKLDMLRNLKEKKDQILSENQSQSNKLNNLKLLKQNKTLLKRDQTMTEIDPSESYMNENVIINNLPENIYNVNKPSDHNLLYKNCFEKCVDDQDDEPKGNSHNESEIILNLDEYFEELEKAKIIVGNDTVSQAENDLMKIHKRSKSQIRYVAMVKTEKPTQKPHFIVAKNELNNNYRPIIYIRPEMLDQLENNAIDHSHKNDAIKNFAKLQKNSECLII